MYLNIGDADMDLLPDFMLGFLHNNHKITINRDQMCWFGVSSGVYRPTNVFHLSVIDI